MLRRLVFLPLLSALLLTLSYPAFNFSFLAWFALIPMLIAIRGEKPWQAFFTGCITGLLFFGATLYWVGYVAIIGIAVLAVYLAFFFGIFAVGVDILAMQFEKPRLRFALLVSCLWVAVEFLRSHLFTGFGWALLGHTQWETLPIIQIADVTGAYGVSFLIVFTNVLISSKIKKKIKGHKPEPRYLALLVIALIIVAVYGYYRVDRKFEGETVKISVIQGNIPQSEKWDERYADAILNKYINLTKEAAKDKPDLIIWPETSVPGFLETDQALRDKVTALAKEVNTYLLVGTQTERVPQKVRYFNSAVLISNKGEMVRRYDKIHLVPFGEYVPLGNSFLSFIKKRYDMGEDYTAGKDYTIFEIPTQKGEVLSGAKGKQVKFGVLICFEDVFPEISRNFVRLGADFLVVITNDAWYMKTAAPFQHAQPSVFRAVENRVNVVRCANTGYSCFINQAGKITQEVKDLKGDKIFVTGFAAAHITPGKARTLYLKYGDAFAWLCAGVFLFDLTLYFIYNYVKSARLRRKNWKK
ncbi:MAG: apolipoprotein N-acyltransferase [Candidatus Omnitrophota bacterium]